MASLQSNSLVSKRALALMGAPPKIVVGHFRCADDPFDPIKNPAGHLNFGTAENFLLDDFLLKKISQFQYTDSKYNHYGPLHGLASTKKAFAAFLNHFFTHEKVEPDHIVIGNGGTGILEMASFAIFNPGDKMLMPAPYYSGFDLDFHTRFGAELIPWQMQESDFEFSQAMLDELVNGGYRAVMLNNPHNPTGQNFSARMIDAIVDCCTKNQIHLLADEVYALSPINPHRNFRSIIDAMGPDRPIHFIYSVAKDFGLSGFKTGFFYTQHDATLQAMKGVSYFYPVSNYTQKLLEFLFLDLLWIEKLRQYNQEKLKTAYQQLISHVFAPLEATHLPVEQGIFAFADLSKLARKKGIATADVFYDRVLQETKVNITPGIYFHDRQLWRFRFCFAKPQSHIEELGRRLSQW